MSAPANILLSRRNTNGICLLILFVIRLQYLLCTSIANRALSSFSGYLMKEYFTFVGKNVGKCTAFFLANAKNLFRLDCQGFFAYRPLFRDQCKQVLGLAILRAL